LEADIMPTAGNSELNVAAIYRSNGFQSRDPAEMRRHVANVLKDHELETYSDGFHADIHWASAGALSLAVLEYGAEVEINPGSLHQFLLVQMPLSGHARVRRSTGDIVLSRETAGVIAPTMPFRILWERGCRQLILKIERQKLEQICQAALGRSLRDPIEFQLDMDLRSGGGLGWQQLIAYLLGLLDFGGQRPAAPLVFAQIEDMIVTHLLSCQPNNYRDVICAEPRGKFVVPRCVKHAEAYIESRAQEPISLADIAAHAGVSIRTLCQSFKTFRNTSPVAALRDVRLEGAREDLLAGGADASVTDIAFRWGFNHLGRFSLLYQKRYGERPLATLRR
jgi:AraC-like DNA-binding protein